MKGAIEYLNKENHKIQQLILKNPQVESFYYYLEDNVSPSTAYNYIRHVSVFLNEFNKTLDKLEIDDITRFFSHHRVNAKEELLTNSYKIQRYQALKLFGEYLVARNILLKNPMDLIKRPQSKDSKETIEKRGKSFLETNEIKSYLENIHDGAGSQLSKKRQEEWKERDLAIIALFLNTGIRASALYRMDVDDINFIKHTITVTDKGSAVRSIAVSTEVIRLITDWLKKREILLAENAKSIEALFISNRKQRMSRDAIAKVVTKYAEQIQGKRITPHKLRATYGTQLYQQTKDIYFVQQCMGHAAPSTTELYVRGVANQTEKAANIMQEIMN